MFKIIDNPALGPVPMDAPLALVSDAEIVVDLGTEASELVATARDLGADFVQHDYSPRRRRQETT